jgi:hypothetical protein
LEKQLLRTCLRELRIKPLNEKEQSLIGEDWNRLYEKPFYRRFSLGAAFWGPFWFLYYRMPVLGLCIMLPLFLAATIYMGMYRTEILSFLHIEFSESVYKPIWEKLTGEFILFGTTILTIGYGAPVALRLKIQRIIRQNKRESYNLTSRNMVLYPALIIALLLMLLSVFAYLANPELFLENLHR